MKKAILVVFVFFVFSSEYCLSQSVRSSAVQDSLSQLSSLIWKQKTDKDKLIANDSFLKQFQAILDSNVSATLLLDSISGITQVASGDGKIKIFTWNVPMLDGTNKYFGFIQLINSNISVIKLTSVGYDSDDFSNATFTAQSWYGALYYKLIETKINECTIYTLLGWDGYTTESDRKIIDVISFDNAGNITFGMPVFKTAQGIKSRIVLEYSEKANALLRYDYQAIRIEKRKKIKKESVWLIVMDRLIPIDPSLKGKLKYYVPAGDVYDGFIWNNYWVLVEDVEVANKSKLAK
jgi:hypothetical protein